MSSPYSTPDAPTVEPSPATAAPAAARYGANAEAALRTVTEIQAAVLSHTDLKAAAAAFVRESAQRLAFDRVTLGLCQHSKVTVVASSDGISPAQHQALTQRLAAAMAEAMDQHCSLSVPVVRDAAHPRITLAQQAVLAAEAGSVVTVPVVANGLAVGVLSAQRFGAGAVNAAELALLEQVANLAAPVLKIMGLNERSWHRRARDGVGDSLAHLQDESKRTLRYGLVAGAVLLAALLLVPAELRVGGHARLEGAVQRVLVAPTDGFLGKVHVRPGDTVKAGQVLVEMAEQDLQIERARWESQLSQHENAYISAQATANRSQLVINQSRAAEAEAQLDLVNAKLARAQLTAPFDGLVIQGDLSQQLGAPLQQGAELMTLAPRDAFRVIVEVDERDIGTVRVGQTGTVALSALPWDTQAIRVVRITPMASVVDGRNVHEVEAALAQPLADMRPGLQGNAHLVVGTAPLLLNWSRRLIDATRLAVWELLG